MLVRITTPRFWNQVPIRGVHLGRLSEEERRRLLDTFDRVVPAIPDRAREEVEAELEEVSRARKESGRE